MIEYNNNTFGAIAPAEEILDLLSRQKDLLKEVKAVHFGTPDELVSIRENKVDYSAIRKDVDELKREFESLKPKGAVKVYQIDDIPIPKREVA
jgi:hypothetical protein